MIGTDLGDLRRSHYSIELASLPEGTDVVVMGWVLTVRGHGNIAFATIRDKLGNEVSMYDFLEKTIPDELNSEAKIELIDEVFSYISNSLSKA